MKRTCDAHHPYPLSLIRSLFHILCHRTYCCFHLLCLQYYNWAFASHRSLCFSSVILSHDGSFVCTPSPTRYIVCSKVLVPMIHKGLLHRLQDNFHICRLCCLTPALGKLCTWCRPLQASCHRNPCRNHQMWLCLCTETIMWTQKQADFCQLQPVLTRSCMVPKLWSPFYQSA